MNNCNSLIQIDNLSRHFQVSVPNDNHKGLLRFIAPHKINLVHAVLDLSFSVDAGEKVAFVGPNGAGKSTTLRMLSGLLRPSSGSASVCGFVPWEETRKLSRQIGLVFGQRSALWPLLPVRDSFDLLGRIYGLDAATRRRRIGAMADLFELHDFMQQAARSLSLGQRMRCDIAAALLHHPRLLFLDEPTIGLDVSAKASLRDHLNAMNKEFGTTILLTSHDTDDIERICDRIVVIDHGKKLLDTSIQDLRNHYTRTKTLRIATIDEIPPYEREGVAVLEHKSQSLTLSVDTAVVSIEQIVGECLARYKLQDIAIENLPLEEVIKTIYLEQKAVMGGAA